MSSRRMKRRRKMAIGQTTVILLIVTSLNSYLAHSSDNGEDELTAFYIQQVTEPIQHMEGPHWLPEEEALYFVDISGHSVHKYHPRTKGHTSVMLNDTVGVVIPIQGRSNEFVIGYGRKISVLQWNGLTNQHSLQNKFTVDSDKPGNRFNDGKADRKGRLWIGTMGEEKPVGVVKKNQGSLFKVSGACELDRVLSPVSISNGMAWTRDNSIMYYIDSETRKIDIIDYNHCSAKRKTFFDFAMSNITGVPDGMTIDSDGNLWVAVWGGGRVIQVSPKGRLMRSVWLPVQRVTSVAWGGNDFTTLFVTTMRFGLNTSELELQPAAGALFEVTGLQAKGLPAHGVSSCYLSLPDLE